LRLDKFLQVSRLIKRRTVAKEVCAAGNVAVNGRPAKPGHIVSEGDVITITWGRKVSSFQVLKVPQGSVPAHQAKSLYKCLEEKQLAPEE
jgi:ribosomal 50S subunit-recycling heat shock protein